jgi:tetratricopeptide (TPR) repeat protein
MIFISYRKDDSADLALSLAERLKVAFGSESVFLDRTGIELGTHWMDKIGRTLAESKVVLALIGSRWLTTYDEFGQRLIDRDDDVLAYELETALQKNIEVIPLYLHGMKPLPEKAFPPRITKLAFKQGTTFDLMHDFPRLIERLETITGMRAFRSKDDNEKVNTSPNHGAKPWHVPDSIGGLFKGRTEAVNALWERLHEKALSPNETAVRRQVICGLGGIGKTRLSIEYAWTFRDKYEAVLFVVADTPAELRRSVSELVDPSILNLPEWKCPEEETRMGSVIRWLCEHPVWLLIIDNADEQHSVEAVEKLLPRLRGGHVIITSRIKTWSKSVKKSELDVLPSSAATAFLLDRTDEDRRKTPDDEMVAAELASEMGYLALALEQAGAYIQQREGGLSLKDYLSRWKEERAQVRGWCNKNLMHYERSVAATWQTTMRALDPAALAMFRILAWFAPNPIPRQMLSLPGVSDIILKAMGPGQSRHANIDTEEALAQLIAYSMTKKIEEQGIACIGLHRLVLQITKEQMPTEVIATTVAAAAELLVLFAPKDAYRPEAWHDWRLLIVHAEAIWKAMSTLDRECWNLELMKKLAHYYLGQGEKEAIPIQREVLALVENRLNPEDPEIFLAKNDLALMLGSDAVEEKEKLYQEALEGRRRVHSEVSEEVGETLFNYGAFLRTHGLPTESEALLRSALEIFNKVDGPEHWRTLMTENELAYLLSERGEYEEADKLHRHALQGSERSLGIGHRDTFTYSTGLCNLLRKRGCEEEAQAVYQYYLSARSLAPDATALERRMMAAECIRSADYANAEKFLWAVLEVNFEVPGTHCHLARVLLLTGRASDARHHVEEAWNRREEAPLYVVARILWFQILFALTEQRAEDVRLFISHLKAVLEEEGAFMEWTMTPVLNELGKGAAGHLDDEALRFLAALVASLNDKSAVSGLDGFPQWHNAKPQPPDCMQMSS